MTLNFVHESIEYQFGGNLSSLTEKNIDNCIFLRKFVIVDLLCLL